MAYLQFYDTITTSKHVHFVHSTGGVSQMIALTKNILTDLCQDSGWHVLHIPPSEFGPWTGIRLYYPGCQVVSNLLYIVESSALPSAEELPEEMQLCVLGAQLPSELRNRACHVEADCGLIPFYTAVQQYLDRLYQWDQKLSDLLLGSGSLQEILDCSNPILRNPCMFLDDHFTLMAFSGKLTEEDNPLFYETVQLGRSPNRLFETLLAMPPQARLNYLPRDNVIVTNMLSGQGELISNCLVDGIPVLRFFMACTITDGNGLRDLVAHLMSRIRSSPGIRDWAKRSSGDYDILFSRLIDSPEEATSQETITSLGLNRYNIFRVAAIDFGSQVVERSAILAKLRVLCPRIRFFVYNDRSYALLGGIQKDAEESPLLAMERLLFHYLGDLSANYGLSNEFTELSALGAACSQAEYTLDYAFQHPVSGDEQRSVGYPDVMLDHMVSHFFNAFPFDIYCPSAFRAILEDSRSNSAVDNTQLLYNYLANQCNATSTARQLHMHRNNVIYRITRLQERYHLDLDDYIQRTLLLMCCIAANQRNHQ